MRQYVTSIVFVFCTLGAFVLGYMVKPKSEERTPDFWKARALTSDSIFAPTGIGTDPNEMEIDCNDINYKYIAAVIGVNAKSESTENAMPMPFSSDLKAIAKSLGIDNSSLIKPEDRRLEILQNPIVAELGPKPRLVDR
jgi:hypothetical protein